MNELYNRYKEMVDDNLISFLPYIAKSAKTIGEAMSYSLEAGGKRLRPVLLLAACEFAGGKAEDALPYAVAIEYIHTYSLIHDDLPAMDNDDLRRGKPTNHVVFGPGIATLAGDGLLNSAMELLIADIQVHLNDPSRLSKCSWAAGTIIRAAGVQGMIGGQVCDIEAENKPCTKEMLEYIHRNKTSALLEAAIEAGLRLGNPDAELMEAMTTYAQSLGLAFQIADDILDVTGTAEELGKNPGMDIARDKATYVSQYGLDGARAKLSELTATAIAALEPYGESAEFFRSLVMKLESRKN